MADKQNVSKELVTVTQWEEALQSSAREHGNIVAEIFSTKWGACRAIAPTFRRIFFEVWRVHNNAQPRRCLVVEKV